MSHTELQKKNAEVVQTALDSARAGQLDIAQPLFADDFVLHVAEGLPHGGIYRGWEGYTQCLKKLKNFWSVTRLNSREFIPVGDDRVFIYFDLDGDMAHNGQRVQMSIVAIWELKEGRITRIRPFYFDTKRFADLAAM